MDRLASLQAFRAEDPDDPFTRFALASEYRKRGLIVEAIDEFDGLVRDHPAYVGTYYHFGKTLADAGRLDDAREMFVRGIRVAEEQRDFHARAELQDALRHVEGLDFDDPP
jgi:tetratricopeptide (TPR) repeat protein